MTKYTSSSNQIITNENLTWGGTEKDGNWYCYFIDPSAEEFTDILTQSEEITEEQYNSAIGI